MILSATVGHAADPGERPRWSIDTGVAFRNIHGDFNLNSPGALPIGGLFSRPSSGRGDAGIFQGGRGRIFYDDGHVGPEGFLVHPGFNDDGSADAVVNNRSQVTPTGRTAVDVEGPGSIAEIAFHSDLTSYSYSRSYRGGSFSSSDDEMGVGPYVHIRYSVIQSSQFDVKLLLGYSWVSGQLSSGTGVLGAESVTETTRTDRFTYTYDNDAGFSGIAAPGAAFPFIDNGSTTIFDAGKWNAFYPGGEARPPRTDQTTSTSSRTVAQFVATGQASLDVNLHEIVFAPEFELHLNDRLHASLSVGPTLNLISTDLDASASWRRRGSNRAVRRYSASQSGTEVRVGIATEGTFTIDITPTVFLQASTSYRYVPSFDVEAGFARATVDTSSWQAGVGLGVRFP